MTKKDTRPIGTKVLVRAIYQANLAENRESRDGESNPGPIHYELWAIPVSDLSFTTL